MPSTLADFGYQEEEQSHTGKPPQGRPSGNSADANGGAFTLLPHFDRYSQATLDAAAYLGASLDIYSVCDL